MRTQTEKKPSPEPRTHLLNPTFTRTKSGRIATITGTCPECRKNRRTIGPADAFQVRRCVQCQRRHVRERLSAARRARRHAARKG